MKFIKILCINILILDSLVSTLSAIENKKYFFITAKSGLVLRSEPTINSNKILVIPFAEQVIILKYSKNYDTIEKIKAKWAKVKYKDKTGWVFSGFLSGKTPLTQYNITKNTIIFYFPILTNEDFELDEGIEETISDYNYYSNQLIQIAEEHYTDIFNCEGKDKIIIKNNKDSRIIEIPIKKHRFGCIFIKKNLKFEFHPGIFTTSVINNYLKFFNISTDSKNNNQ